MKCRHCGATRSMSRPGLSSATCEHCHARPIAAATTTGEGSGLIDIRAMAAALGASPMRPPTPLPGFRGLAPAAPPAPTRRLTVRPSQTPLHALLGVLVFGMVGLAGAVVHSATRTAPTVVVVEEVVSQLTSPDEPDVPDLAEVAEVPEPEPEAQDQAAPPSAEPDRPVAARPRPRTGPRTPEVGKPMKPTPTVAPAPEKTVDRTSVACLLDPRSCAGEREAAPPARPAAPVASSDLPAKLEPADIGDGTRAAKAAAMSRCARLARGGEVVKIKLSIAGPSGSVLGAGAESDGGNPALAGCAAGELKAAQFKPVQKPQIGAVVTLKF